MTVFTYLLMGFLILCAVSVSLSKNLLNSILIYMSYSLIMSIIWVTLESPDLAITEAAVGAGVTSILFFVTLKKIHAIEARKENMPDVGLNEAKVQKQTGKERGDEQKENGAGV